MITKNDLFHVGFISKSHGYSGYFYLNFINSFHPTTNLEGFVFLFLNGKAVPFYIEHCADLSEKFALIKLEDITSKEQIAVFSGFEVYLEKKLWLEHHHQLEVLPAFLIGFQLFDSEYKYFGIIVNINSSPAHFLMELDNQCLIPLHNDLIINIDERKKIIIMDLPDGLI